MVQARRPRVVGIFGSEAEAAAVAERLNSRRAGPGVFGVRKIAGYRLRPWAVYWATRRSTPPRGTPAECGSWAHK